MKIQQFTLVNVLISVGLIFRSCSGSNSKEQAGKKQRNAFVKVDGRIRWASENRIYVMPDMHPDLYPVQFSDGAPDWATLTDGQPHQTGVVWSDAYLISSAVQTAFGNFRKTLLLPTVSGFRITMPISGEPLLNVMQMNQEFISSILMEMYTKRELVITFDSIIT